MLWHNEPKKPASFSLAGCFCCFRSEISASDGRLSAEILDLGLSGGRKNSELLAVPLAVFGPERFRDKQTHRANNTI
jgi:hypothetical protein